MDELRPDALETVAARVVAWHNRHPLAHRITAEQVQSVGFVALPYLPPPEAASTGKSPQAAATAPDAPAGGSLRERAQARAQQAGSGGADKADKVGKAGKAAKPSKAQSKLQPAFTEDFIAPLSPRRVARWAARHGIAAAQAPRGAPLRQVDPDAAFSGKARELQTLYVLTAAVESRGKRVRMLLSPGAEEAVLGNHLWSPPRLAGGAVAALGSLAALGLALALLWQPAPPAPATAKAGPASQSGTVQVEPVAGSAALPSIKPPSLRAAALADAGLTDPSRPPASAASAASRAASHQAPSHAAAEPPADVEPTLGRISLPSLGMPHLDEALAAARERRLAQHAPAAPAPSAASAPVGEAGLAPPLVKAASPAPAPAKPAAVAVAASAATATTPPTPAAPATPPAPGKPPADALPPPGHVFALSSRRLRTRAESEQTMAAMKSLLATSGLAAVQVEVVPAEDDWRVVGWPFAQRAQAEKARTLLASRGIRLEVVDF